MDDSVKILEPGMDFRVGDWLVRPTRGVMQSNGQEQRLKPKAMAVLQCLARANGHVVTRNELFDTVWPGATTTLSTCRSTAAWCTREPLLLERLQHDRRRRQ